MSEQARIVQTRSGRKVTRKTARRKTPAEAVEILEQYFDRARYITELTKDERVSLVEQTGLPDRKICCWWANRRVKANRDQQREDEQHRAAAGSLALGSTSSAYDSLMRLYESATAQRMTSPEPSLTQWSSGSSSDHTSILEQTIAPESYSDMTWLADSITPSALTFLDVHYFCFGNPADPWIAASTGERQCSAHIDTITSDLIYTILDEDKQLHMTMPATSIVSIHLMFVSGTDDASIYVQLSRAPIFTAVSPEEGCLITGDWSPQERASATSYPHSLLIGHALAASDALRHNFGHLLQICCSDDASALIGELEGSTFAESMMQTLIPHGDLDCIDLLTETTDSHCFTSSTQDLMEAQQQTFAEQFGFDTFASMSL